jgi:anti-sigma regulatory factor (Ser/Thr protein kinase)
VAVPADALRERQTLRLPADPDAVGEARRWASELARDLVEPRVRADLQLVISEVVTNALQHGAAPGESILVAVTPKEEFLCVQVTDAGPGLAPRPRATTPKEHGGFGLFLIEQLTRRWGMTRERQHTRVWFELDYHAAG